LPRYRHTSDTSLNSTQDHNKTGCGHAGFNPASSSVPPSPMIGGAYCCLPLPSNSTHIQYVSPTQFATASGATSKPAVIVFKASDASADAAISCRVSAVKSNYPSGGYNLDWSSARLVKNNSISAPGDFHLFPIAVRINATAVACSMPAVSVSGPGELAISVDGNQTWSVGVPIMFFDAVSAAIARRPYFAEAEGHLILQSDPTLRGAMLDVTVLLTSANKTWIFPGIPGGANAKLLALPFAGLPQMLNNDLVVTVTVRGGGTADSPWKRAAGAVVTTIITIYTRLIRAAPPPSSSNAVPVQIDREHVGSLLVGGKQFSGIGWYINLNMPTCVSGATPRNTCDEGIPNIESMAAHLVILGKQGVNLAFMYHLSSYNESAQAWLFDQAQQAGVRLILALPTAPPGGESACGEFNNTAFKARIASAVAVAKDHAATLGYFICDDCDASSHSGWAGMYRCIALKAQLYNFIRVLDPYHILAGAVSGTKGWWFSDASQGFLPATPNVLTQPTLQLGSQPTTQLSIDLPLMENYNPPLDAHTNGANTASVNADSAFTQGLSLDPVVNSAGLWFPRPPGFPAGARTYPSAAAFNSVMWLGVIEGGMTHQLAFIYGEFEEVLGGHNEFTSEVGTFGKQLAQLSPAIHRSVATDEPPHPRVAFGSDTATWRARAWRVGGPGNLTVYVVVVNLKAPSARFTLTIIDVPELRTGSWITARQQQQQGPPSTLNAGVLSDEVAANATSIYSITRAKMVPHLLRLKTDDGSGTASVSAVTPSDEVLLLFTDRSLFTSFDDTSLRLEMHRPEKGPLVIWPTEPWETGGNSCYNHVLQYM
jgi:hypothetical protein